MIKGWSRSPVHYHGHLRTLLIRVVLCSVFAGCICMPGDSDVALAFYTYHKKGQVAQHALITSLVRFPKRNQLFVQYHLKLAAWSEESDTGKDFLTAHGAKIMGIGRNEEDRARDSFTAAVKHHNKYMANPAANSVSGCGPRHRTAENDLEAAAQCLANAYHYFEDIADFSGDNHKGVTEALKILHQMRINDPRGFTIELEIRKQNISHDYDKIIAYLKSIEGRRSRDQIQENLLDIVACLELINVCFLAKVQSPDSFGPAGTGITTPLAASPAPPMESADSPGPGLDQGFGPAETGRTDPASPPPSWSPPLSHGDDIGARGQPVTPDAYRWYVVCDRANGTVVFGKDQDPSRHVILAGPFEGPRTAQNWIGQNCPAARCNAQGACMAGPPPAAAPGSGWYVLCNRHDGSVVYGQHPDMMRHIVMAGPLAGAQGATAWIQANCPSARCTQMGSCAAAPASGGSWYVLCNRDDGNVVLSKNVDPFRQIVWQSGFRGEWDARQWISANCPSARCDQNGRCVQQGPSLAPLPQPGQPAGLNQPSGDRSAFCQGMYRRLQDSLRDNRRANANQILQSSRHCWFYADGVKALQQTTPKPPAQDKPQPRPSPGKPGPVVTPTPSKPSADCNRRARCENWDTKDRRWIRNSGYGGGFGQEFEVGGSCMGQRQIRCWDDCDKRWRCYETR